MIEITKRHPFSGKTNTMKLDITETQLANWKGGMLIQKAMPNLTPDEREFLITGLMPMEYDSIYDGTYDASKTD